MITITRPTGIRMMMGFTLPSLSDGELGVVASSVDKTRQKSHTLLRTYSNWFNAPGSSMSPDPASALSTGRQSEEPIRTEYSRGVCVCVFVCVWVCVLGGLETSHLWEAGLWWFQDHLGGGLKRWAFTDSELTVTWKTRKTQAQGYTEELRLWGDTLSSKVCALISKWAQFQPLLLWLPQVSVCLSELFTDWTKFKMGSSHLI